MSDPYLYENTSVLRNLLDIRDSADLDLIESEQASINMLSLYETGFGNFTTDGLCEIHRSLFGDIYEWAGKLRVINIKKNERIIAGASVWYSDVNTIKRDLNKAWKRIRSIKWVALSKEVYVSQLVRCFSEIWQAHPFREGNTRTVVTMMTFFIESHGYFVEKDLLAASAGYVRDSFVMASLGQYAEPEHLERIMMDAISEEDVAYSNAEIEDQMAMKDARYEKYTSETYTPVGHEYRGDDEVIDPNVYRKAKWDV